MRQIEAKCFLIPIAQYLRPPSFSLSYSFTLVALPVPLCRHLRIACLNTSSGVPFSPPGCLSVAPAPALWSSPSSSAPRAVESRTFFQCFFLKRSSLRRRQIGPLLIPTSLPSNKYEWAIIAILNEESLAPHRVVMASLPETIPGAFAWYQKYEFSQLKSPLVGPIFNRRGSFPLWVLPSAYTIF